MAVWEVTAEENEVGLLAAAPAVVVVSFLLQPLLKRRALYGNAFPPDLLAGLFGSIIGLRSRRLERPTRQRASPHSHNVFANCPPFHYTNTLFCGFDCGIIFSSYSPHQIHKLLTLELFTAKRLQQLQYITQEELCGMLNRLCMRSSQAINTEHYIAEMLCDVTTRLLQSRRLAEELPPELPERFHDLQHARVPTLGDFIPWLCSTEGKMEAHPSSSRYNL